MRRTCESERLYCSTDFHGMDLPPGTGYFCSRQYIQRETNAGEYWSITYRIDKGRMWISWFAISLRIITAGLVFWKFIFLWHHTCDFFEDTVEIALGWETEQFTDCSIAKTLTFQKTFHFFNLALTDIGGYSFSRICFGLRCAMSEDTLQFA